MYAQILDGLGDRPLGLEADQLVIEIARWIKGRAGVGKLRLKASGISSQVAATVAAALKPDFAPASRELARFKVVSRTASN